MKKTERNREASRRLFLADVARWVAPALGGAALLAVGFWLSHWSKKKRVSFDPAVASICHGDYTKARTLADTQMVDLRAPVLSRSQAPNAITCGAIRRAGGSVPQ